jgi:peptide subunit release factor 1 (eRF1)
MLEEQDLQELISYPAKSPVLSVYLNTDPATGSADSTKLRLRQMLKKYEADSAEDVARMHRYIEHEYAGAGRSLAVFSSAAEGFFRSHPLSLPVRDRVRLLDRPYVKPLVDLLDNYGHLGVALVDQQGARLFHFHLGVLREQEGTVGEEIRKTKRGGGSQAPGRRGGVAERTRDTDETADRNLRAAVEFATRFFSESRIRRVLIGGTDENVARFIELLPKTWRSLVMGSFPVEMSAGHSEVYDKALSIAQQAEREAEARLVTAVITAAAKGQGGVVRLDDTLQAAHAGQVQTLVICEGLQAPGYRCQGCEFLTAQAIDACPFCGESFEKIPDAVEMAVRRVIRDGGEVVVVRDSRELEKAGSIGAQLRY